MDSNQFIRAKHIPKLTSRDFSFSSEPPFSIQGNHKSFAADMNVSHSVLQRVQNQMLEADTLSEREIRSIHSIRMFTTYSPKVKSLRVMISFSYSKDCELDLHEHPKDSEAMTMLELTVEESRSLYTKFETACRKQHGMSCQGYLNYLEEKDKDPFLSVNASFDKKLRHAEARKKPLHSNSLNPAERSTR